jgi:hypothetical protein
LRLFTLSQFLRERAIREPGVVGYLDGCEEVEPCFLTYEEWCSSEQNMALTAPVENPTFH